MQAMESSIPPLRKICLNGEPFNFLNNLGLVGPDQVSLEEVSSDLFSKTFQYVDKGNHVHNSHRSPSSDAHQVVYSTMYQYIWSLEYPLSHKKFIDNTFIFQERNVDRVRLKLRQAFAHFDMVPEDFHDLVNSKYHMGTFFATCKNTNGTMSEASISIWNQNLVSPLKVAGTGECKKYFQLYAPYSFGPYGNKLFHELLLYIHNHCFKMGIHYLYINLDENSNMRHFFPLQKGFEVNKYLEVVQPLTQQAEDQLKFIVNNKRKDVFSDPRDHSALVVYPDEYRMYLIRRGRL